MTVNSRLLLAGTVVVSLAAVAAALVSQHVAGIQPCPWCVLQRLTFLLVAVFALAGLLLPAVAGRRLGAALALLLACSGAATALWQHFVAAKSASCAMTLADRIMTATGLDERWPELFAAYASCAEAKATLLGVPYEFYSLTLFVLVGAATLRVLIRPR